MSVPIPMIRMMALLQNFWKIVVPVLQKNFTDLIKQVGIAATLAVGLQSYTVQDIYQNSWMFRLEPAFEKSMGNFAKSSRFNHFDPGCLSFMPNPVGSG